MRQMKDFPWGITKVTPETFSKAGGIWPGVGEIPGLLRGAGIVKRV